MKTRIPRSQVVKSSWLGALAGIGAAAALALGSSAYAGEAAPAVQEEIQRLKDLVAREAEEMERQARQLEEQRRALEAQRRRLENLEAQFNRASEPRVQPAVYPVRPPLDCVNRRCKVLRTAEEKKQEAPGPPGAPGRRIKPVEELQIPGIAERVTALTKQGTLVVEPSIEYNTTSLNRVILEGFTIIPAITIGSIDIREVDRNVLTGAVALRYGVTDLFELDVKMPYVYRQDSTTTRPIGTGAGEDITTDVSGDGLGDIEFSAHYQVVAGNDWPFVILNGRVKTPTGKDPFEVDLDSSGLETELPTGTGFWGLEPGVTVLFPSDPVVFFGTVSYLLNLSGTKTLQTTGASVDVDPGDAARFSFGMGFAINERASFSLGYEHSFVFESVVDGEDVGGSDLQVGSFLVGASYRVTDDTTVNLTVGVGATEEAPDVTLRLRVPMSWKIF